MHWLVGRKDFAAARAVDAIRSTWRAREPRCPERARRPRRVRCRRHRQSIHRRRDIGLWAGHFGDPALAFKALRAAIDEQASAITFVWLPQLEPMRQLPEFKAYMRDIGMVAYWQEYGWPSFCNPLDAHDFECR
jgi:hypothetical protein